VDLGHHRRMCVCFGVATCRGPDARHAWLVRGVQARRARRRTTEGDHAVRVRAPHSRLRAPGTRRRLSEAGRPGSAGSPPARSANTGRRRLEAARVPAVWRPNGQGSRRGWAGLPSHALKYAPSRCSQGGARLQGGELALARQGCRLRTRPPRAAPAHRARARASGPGKQDGVAAATCVSAASQMPVSLLLRAARGARSADGPEPRRSGPRPASTWRGAPGPACPRSSSARDARRGAGGAAAPAAIGSQPCWVCSVSKGEARAALARARAEGTVPRAAGGAAAGPDGGSSRKAGGSARAAAEVAAARWLLSGEMRGVASGGADACALAHAAQQGVCQPASLCETRHAAHMSVTAGARMPDKFRRAGPRGQPPLHDMLWVMRGAPAANQSSFRACLPHSQAVTANTCKAARRSPDMRRIRGHLRVLTPTTAWRRWAAVKCTRLVTQTCRDAQYNAVW